MPKKYVLKRADVPAAFTIDYKKELNPEQYAVATTADGPCLVLAGAGSGKTRTLIYRVAYLLEKGVRPEEILLVTFTNKAAQEMRNRVELLIQGKAQGLWCGTFHHAGNRTLRQYGKHIGLDPDFGILDDEDQRDLIKACVKAVEPAGQEAKFPKPGVVQSVLSYAVNADRPLGEVIAKKYPYFLNFAKDFEKIRAMYEERKRRSKNLDYDDLLLKWIEFLETPGPARDRYRAQFKYCLVDEYQDTNRLQHRVMRLLAEDHGNLLVVGDDAQSIYSFRAANVRNILDFPGEHEGTKLFKLETNYRSTKPILDLANKSISHNVHQFPKTLKSARGDGPRPQWVKLRDPRQEAAFVAQRVVEFQETGVPLTEIAVLFRARYQAAELEMELAKRGIPYVIRGGIRFFEQAHVKDVLSYLRILANPQDELAWTRALTMQNGIGAGYAEKIYERFRGEGKGDLARVATGDFGHGLPPRVRDGFENFRKILKALLRDDRREHPDALIEQVLEGGYNKYVLLTFDNAKDRLEDLRELVNFAHTYRSLKEFLADASLREGFKGETITEAPADDETPEHLVLSTIHQAKGLEWRAVFVIALSEGQFPHARSMDSEEELEEERRLFYVASTRAKDELFLCHAMTRFDYAAGTVISRPSPFVIELPSSCTDEIEVEESQEERTIYLDE